MPNILETKPCLPCESKLRAEYSRLRGQLREMEIPLPQNEAEFQSLCVIVGRAKPKCFVEIGSRDGGSLWMLAQFCAPGALVISIDLPGARWGRNGSDENKRRVMEDLRGKKFEVRNIQKDSQHESTRAELCKTAATQNSFRATGSKIDFLFIDGDHRFQGVLRDWELYHPLVAHGGMVAFHDITERPSQPRIKVFCLWRSLKTVFRHAEFISNPKSPGIGVLWK